MEEKRFKVENFFRSLSGFRNISGISSGLPYSPVNGEIFRLKKGFTLIEILVVIAMIGILATASMMLINPSVQLQKSRDSKRKSDIKIIQSALELYRSEQGTYPASTNNSVVTCAQSFTLNGLCDSTDTVYLQTVPMDPKTQTNYFYCSSTDTGGCSYAPSGGYALYACLENSNDSDRLMTGAVNPPIPNSGTVPCTSGAYYGVVNP
jgi:general secretion pathway protein G